MRVRNHNYRVLKGNYCILFLSLYSKLDNPNCHTPDKALNFVKLQISILLRRGLTYLLDLTSLHKMKIFKDMESKQEITQLK